MLDQLEICLCQIQLLMYFPNLGLIFYMKHMCTVEFEQPRPGHSIKYHCAHVFTGHLCVHMRDQCNVRRGLFCGEWV